MTSWIDSLFAYGAASTATYLTVAEEAGLTSSSSLAAGTGLALTYGSGSATMALAGVAGVAGSYTTPYSITIDAYGRISAVTQASNITLPAGHRTISVTDSDTGGSLSLFAGNSTAGPGGSLSLCAGNQAAVSLISGAAFVCSGRELEGVYYLGFCDRAEEAVERPVLTAYNINQVVDALVALGLVTLSIA